MGQVRDRLRRPDHRRVQVGGERDHVREVLIAARLQRDRGAGRTIGEDPVDPGQLRVEPELIGVIGRLRRELATVGRDAAVEEVGRRVPRVGQRLAVESRAIACETEVALIRDEAQLRAHGAAERGLKSTDRDRECGLSLRDGLQPIEHGEVARRIRGRLVRDDERPSGVAILARRRLHVRDRIVPGPSPPDLAGDIDKHAVRARHHAALVERSAQALIARVAGRPQLDLLERARGRVGSSLAARARGRARAVVEAGEQDAGAVRKGQPRRRRIECRGIGVDIHPLHREAVVVQRRARCAARVIAVRRGALTRLERVADHRDVATRVRGEPRLERAVCQRRRREHQSRQQQHAQPADHTPSPIQHLLLPSV